MHFTSTKLVKILTMKLINFSNQLAAGPKNIALNFIKEILANNKDHKYIFLIPSLDEYLNFNDTDNVSFVFVEIGDGLMEKIIKTVKINWVIIPKICKEKEVDGILAFGNFLTYASGLMKKVVLLHHPHIVDDELFYSLQFPSMLTESIKRFVFFLTVRNVDTVVVQSQYMLDVCVKKFPKYKGKFKVIYNPISKNFASKRSKEHAKQRLDRLLNKKKYKLLYVSRFYPHKNHEFLLKLAQLFERSDLQIEVFVTIDPLLPGALEFLKTVDELRLPIFNLGEIIQSELAKHYLNSDLMIFPSNAETFGNPIIESMFFSLPLIMPNKDYALTLLGNKGAYYDSQSEESCLDLITGLLTDREKYYQYSIYCYERSFLFPDSKNWVNKYVKLLEASDEI